MQNKQVSYRLSAKRWVLKDEKVLQPQGKQQLCEHKTQIQDLQLI